MDTTSNIFTQIKTLREQLESTEKLPEEAKKDAVEKLKPHLSYLIENYKPNREELVEKLHKLVDEQVTAHLNDLEYIKNFIK